MSTNAFKDYLIQAGQYPLLSPEEELELGRRIQEDHDQEAREKLICSNLRLVVSIAKQYRNQYVGIDDLVEEGNLGLIAAVDRYDYKLGYRFSTCATPWIKQAILRALTQNGRSIRLPAHTYQQLNQMRKFVEKYTAENSEEPTKAQIAAALGVDEARIDYLMQWRQDTISASTPLSNDEDQKTLIETLPDNNDYSPVDYVEDTLTHDEIMAAIDKLPERTQKILKMRYGLGGPTDPEDWSNPHTLEEVGAYIGITRERVRQIEKDALQKLQTQLQTWQEGMR